MEIVSGVHRVDGIRGANSYLVVGQGPVLVIDTGMPGSGKKIVECIKKLGRRPDEVEWIVLTHADIDHSGSAAELKQMTGAKVAIHGGDASSLSGKSKPKKARGIMAPIFKMMNKVVSFHPLQPDVILSEGDEIGGFRVIHTPGHTQGSICLYKAKELIVAGDALKADKGGNLKPPSRMMTLDMARAKASLKRISELEFDALLVGHGAPVLGNASEKVRRLLAKVE